MKFLSGILSAGWEILELLFTHEMVRSAVKEAVPEPPAGEEKKEKQPVGFTAENEKRKKTGPEKKPAPKKKESFGEELDSVTHILRSQFTTRDERNALVMDLVLSMDLDVKTASDGAEAILGIEAQKLSDALHPMAENRFNKVLAQLVADARARFADNPRKLGTFLKKLLALAKTDSEKFRLVLEMSDDNGFEQAMKKIDLEAGNLAARLDGWYEKNSSWVRREKEHKGIFPLFGAYIRELLTSAIEAKKSKRSEKGGAA
jgi:hypothetical protein